MKIGEMARVTSTRVETVRYYEQIGLLPPPARTAGNYRAYDEDHLARLSFIRRARDLGFSLDAVRELLDLANDRIADCAAVDALASQHLADIDRKMVDLARLRERLASLIDSCAGGVITDCRILEALEPGAPSGSTASRGERDA
ncbi:MAG: MerR family transcriptional regulator [Sphingopyxis sp.]|nr:MerR family transcriptional regulator [Sphingopyxis sp.]